MAHQEASGSAAAGLGGGGSAGARGPDSAAAAAAIAVGGVQVSPSLTSPEILSMYQRLQDAEVSRQKRLARNRASARLRRLKHKSRVEQLEVEISQLNATLSKLREHTWGADDGGGLREALGKEPALPSHMAMPRRTRLKYVMRMAMSQCSDLQSCSFDNLDLCQSIAAAASGSADGAGPAGQLDASQLAAADLFKELDLSPRQIDEISSLGAQAHDEALLCAALNACVMVLVARDLLSFEVVGIAEVSEGGAAA